MTLLDDLNALTDDWRNHSSDEEAELLAVVADELQAVITRHSRPISDTNHNTLTRLASGATTRDLANQLRLSLGGVNYHVKTIHRAYRVDTTVQAVMQALRAGHLLIENVEGKWEGDPPSDAELHVLQAVADHGTNEAAGRAVNLKRPTVAKHLHNMTFDAGCSTKVQLVVRAYREGWVR